MSVFKKAVRSQAKLRLCLMGPSGSGKTFSALAIAAHLGKRVAVIDSERGSASLYAGATTPDGTVLEFDVLELTSFAPSNYVRAIKEAEREGYDVIVVDSLSQAWAGKDGALEMVDKASARSKTGNSFTAWRDVTPEHNALVDALVGANAHVIATLRVKMAYELQENERGKKTPVKIGLAPIQRDGLDYEFTVTGDMDLEHVLTISKTRCPALDRGVFKLPGRDVADVLTTWMADAAPVDASVAAPVAEAPYVEPPRLAFAPEAPPSDGGMSNAELVGCMVEVDLPKCTQLEHLVPWAKDMLSLHGKVRNSQPWKAFATRCADLELSPRDVVAAAQKEGE